MTDLISRQAAIDEAKEWIDAVYFEENDKRERKAIECFIGSLKNMPTADVVEVVRCKDCVKREICRTTTIWAAHPDNDWFCADGERADV